MNSRHYTLFTLLTLWLTSFASHTIYVNGEEYDGVAKSFSFNGDNILFLLQNGQKPYMDMSRVSIDINCTENNNAIEFISHVNRQTNLMTIVLNNGIEVKYSTTLVSSVTISSTDNTITVNYATGTDTYENCVDAINFIKYTDTNQPALRHYRDNISTFDLKEDTKVLSLYQLEYLQRGDDNGTLFFQSSADRTKLPQVGEIYFFLEVTANCPMALWGKSPRSSKVATSLL